MRAFLKLRELLATHVDLVRKIGELEAVQKEHGGHLAVISTALKKLMDVEKPLKSVIGFQVDN